MPEVAIVVTAKDKASKTLGGIGGSLQKLGKVAAVAGAAGVAALGGIALGATKLAVDAAKLEPTRVTFDNLSKSIGSTADAMLKKLRPAAMGIVSDADLMQAANKLMAMGLAETEEEAAKLTEMATTLGMAMGEDATVSMENFALMLANQSIPRLDSFGISSGKVRERILELMEADKSLTRETAFMTAVMEQGEAAMEKVGDISGTSAVTMAQFGATMDNLKMVVGEALLPVLKVFLDTVLIPLAGRLQDLIGVVQDRLAPAFEAFASEQAPRVSEFFARLKDLFMTYVIPAVETLVGLWWGMVTALADLGTKLGETLIPKIEELWGWMQDNLAPIFKEFIDEFGPQLMEALEEVGEEAEELATIFNEIVVPVLQDAWDRTEGLREALVRLAESSAVKFLKFWLDSIAFGLLGMVRAINLVIRTIGALIRKIGEAINWLRSLAGAVPSWLLGMSPSPLELSIRGIADAFRELGMVSGGFVGTPYPAAAPATSERALTISIGEVYGMGAYQEAIQEAFREASKYSL